MSQGGQADGIPSYPMFQVVKPGVSQKVTVTGTSAQSSALGAGTSIVRLFATVNMFILVGTNPTALADGTNMFLPAGIETYVAIAEGSTPKIAAIQNSVSGTLYITEGA